MTKKEENQIKIIKNLKYSIVQGQVNFFSFSTDDFSLSNQKTRYEIWIFELTIEAKGNYSNFEMGPQPGIVCRRDKACLEKLAQTFAPTPKSSMVQKGGSSGKIDR